MPKFSRRRASELEHQPGVEEYRVVAAGLYKSSIRRTGRGSEPGGAIEHVVVGVKNANPGVEPRPNVWAAIHKRQIGEIEVPAG